MKVAIVSESPADEAAVKILVDAVLGIETSSEPLRVRPNGWPDVLRLLPKIIQILHYGSEAEAIVVVADTDDSKIHDSESPSRICDVDCRQCAISDCLRSSIADLRPLVTRSGLQKAVGVAIPAIEAWYRCGVDPHVNEVTWGRHLSDGEQIGFTRRTLKIDTYGLDAPPLHLETEIAEWCAIRLTDDLDQLARLFPIGFGCLLADLRSWTI